jgi:hypothetical protein
LTKKRRVGVIGSFVWDVIHGRHANAAPVEEWGGISYGLAGLDAALDDDWEIVPIIKVGEDLAHRATHFIRTFERIAPDAALISVPYPNNRVELRYIDDERRTEMMRGGVPGWTWLGLKPVLEMARLDALYVNFLSGWEIDVETAQLIRRTFAWPIYCDLHMLAWAIQPDGYRTLRPIPNVREWCSSFDFLQVNEDEMTMLAPDPMALAATALHAGARSLSVTMGKRGAVYFAAPDFDRLDVTTNRPASAPATSDAPTQPRSGSPALSAPVGTLRTALVPAEHVEPGDPTGCGDVWGATQFSRLLAGDKLHAAILAANRAAARNVGHRGATGLADHLRGKISLT